MLVDDKQAREKIEGVTREQIEAFRREQWIPTTNVPLEPWAIEENRVLTAICDYALKGLP